MGGWFSRESHGRWFSGGESEKHDLVIANHSQLSLHLWVNGGGPVVRLKPTETITASLPAHLRHTNRQWTATLDLPGSGLAGLTVCTWSQNSLQLKVPLGAQESVDSQLARVSGDFFGGYPLTVRTFDIIVRKQREVKKSMREWLLRKQAVWRKTRVRAAKLVQQATRTWLARHRLECPVCLDDLPWFDTKKMCQKGRHRLCGTCATRYLDLALGEGKLYVRCPGIGCAEVFPKDALKKLASAPALAAYEANLAGVHTQRLADESDRDFLRFASEHARRCPACQVLIWRYEGCDHMQCRCGTSFNWSSPEARLQLA